MPKGPITIRDIALKLDISISTVSRALSDKADVNAETRKKVLAMAQELNYEPNVVAQSLRSSRTHTIGIVVPDVKVHFFGSVVSGIQSVASKEKYNVIFCESNESYDSELSNIKTLVANRVDGLLVSLSRETTTIEHLLKVQQKNIPMVLFDRTSHDINTYKVEVSDKEGAQKAVKHLIDTGCKRIAFLAGPENLEISNKRKEGYIEALQEANMAINEQLIIHSPALHEEAQAATNQLLELPEKPDAIFCINDLVAIQSMKVIKNKGLHIPNDISIMGFSNDPISELIEPSLSTVAQPSYDMGRCAAKLLFDQLNGEVTSSRTLTLDTELILRHSTKPL